MTNETLRESLSDHPVAMVLSDPLAEDNPLVYVNSAFERLTLYNSEAAIGRNCRFLQTNGTDKEVTRKIREALEAEREISADILNQRADGSTFLNRVVIAPLRGTDGRVCAFLGIQSEVKGEAHHQHARVSESGGESLMMPEIAPETEQMLRELQHRVKNHLSMVVSLIRLQSKQEVTPASFDALSHRIQSLALLYEELSPQGVGDRMSDNVPAGAYMSRIANTIGALDGRSSVRLNIACEELTLSLDTAARLGLLLTEFLTNAFEHAFVGRDAGVIQITLRRQTRGALRLTVEDDGIGMPEGANWPFGAKDVATHREEARDAGDTAVLDTRGTKRKSGAGGSIVSTMLKSLDADLRVSSTVNGTIINLDFSAPEIE